LHDFQNRLFCVCHVHINIFSYSFVPSSRQNPRTPQEKRTYLFANVILIWSDSVSGIACVVGLRGLWTQSEVKSATCCYWERLWCSWCSLWRACAASSWCAGRCRTGDAADRSPRKYHIPRQQQLKVWRQWSHGRGTLWQLLQFLAVRKFSDNVIFVQRFV